jgi:superfamily II DNA/RNA helicase
MLQPLADLTDMPLKIKELLSVLQKRRVTGGRIQQTVIFTRFYDTLTDIVGRLRRIEPTKLIGTYSGKGGQYVDTIKNRLRGVNREEIKHRFCRYEIDVLVCTDAAAEGLNLQTADLIINYDLPWNPMKVGQRIGRIDRIGQAHDRVYVLNLCYVDSAEQIVYDRLLTRLTQAGEVVGMQQISMLPVTEEEFAELAAGTLKEQTLGKG